jgi:sterol desaturase/sphingolipid hydroxylase (fatty acid hydroxylase superfamily)
MNAPESSRVAVNVLDGTESTFERLVFWALHPVLLVLVVGAWIADPSNPLLYPVALVGVHLLIGALEYRIPARPRWHQPAREKIGLLGIGAVTFVIGGTAADWYETLLAAPLASLRTALDLDIWPHDWPLLAQVFMVFFASEFLWYWMHRAEHRWPLVWRSSGHGAHHAFKKLNAINAGANHPIELFWIVLPALLVDLLFGVGVAAYGALLLTTIQVAIVHSNLRLNSRGIGWLLTTNAWHIRHHSANLEESNTNFGCAAILWDRVFGTFGDSGVVEAGIGPREPTTLEKLWMPIREPQGSVIAPRTDRAPSDGTTSG